MNKTTLRLSSRAAQPQLSVTWVHTLVVGSGAAGLNAAVQLHKQGVTDVMIATEGLRKGTSINTGSDKQTYYKLSLCGDAADSPRAMAESYTAGGSMHADLALVEASQSARAFLHLVDLGVPFPTDGFGQYVGYKTDHDPCQRATSIGPYTSREMCRVLIEEVRRRAIPVRERCEAVSLLTVDDDGRKRAAGMLALDATGKLEAIVAENVVFATGGPGGLYRASVYPLVHTGAIGVALMAGAKAQSLPESQYGLASIKFRWNVSGTYMQAIPRFVSTAADGSGSAVEFMRDYFASAGEMHSQVFLKGYQWPFDPRKVVGGSSIIDILVYIESVVRGRRVYLDFRSEPRDFTFEGLSVEARQYLDKSRALLDTPLARLGKMNPGAVALYKEHGINLALEPLEIAVCAQHNNGGLAGDRWWQSLNIGHLFPVGEVNGSHGVYRPGGSALNAGQVGALRSAEYIAHAARGRSLKKASVRQAILAAAAEALTYISTCRSSRTTWQAARCELQERMSRAGAHIRSRDGIRQAAAEAETQWQRLADAGCRFAGVTGLAQALKTRQLCFAHYAYLDALRFAIESGVGSRGSAMVLDRSGQAAHPKLGAEWRFAPENPEFRRQVQETLWDGRAFRHEWVPCRALPRSDLWFENAWAAYREGRIYEPENRE
ncbi:MAG: FAD-binding protein [Kiritimatiellae bacterium]|nr:FAD-binding protein [Kiritimatiellia bacterium]